MSNQETAIRFIQCFCAGDVAGLSPLLCDDLQFCGPFHQFNSRDAYLAVLTDDPPEPCDFQLLVVTHGIDSVVVFYEYQKPEHHLTVAQWFRFRNERISGITLVFDGRSFDESASSH